MPLKIWMLANHSKSIKKITFNNPRASFNIRRHAGWCVGVGEEKMKRVPSRFGSLALLYFSRLPVLSYRTVSILILISGIDKLREFMIYCSFSCLFEEYFGTSLSKGKCAGHYNIAKSVQCALDCPISPKSFAYFSTVPAAVQNFCQRCKFLHFHSFFVFFSYLNC